MIPLFKVHIPQSVIDPLRETLLSGFIGQGKKVDEFERKIGRFLGNDFSLTTNSGTSAIQLALRLANVGPGDKVITTPMSCSATMMPILAAGADIIWADIDPWTGNIDPQSVKDKMTMKTKAVICVHWGGYPCDLEELNYVTQVNGIPLIEDAAHAFGSTYKGSMVGAISPYTCFSFQAIKTITTVDGGCLSVLKKGDYERGKLIRWYGIDREQPRGDFRCELDIAEYGLKWHMNDVAATIGIEQMKFVWSLLEQTRANAEYFNEEFKNRNIKSVSPLRYDLQKRSSSYWLYTVRAENRNGFVAYLNSRGVMCSRVHQRNDIHSYARNYAVQLPGVDEFNEQQCSIPVGWWLTPDDRRSIMDLIEAWDKGTRCSS
jgi:perosamine synthetase